jgi:beta-lactamase regulating signal transducer with metallopeptidase domain
MISELLNNWFNIIADTTIKGTLILLITLAPIIFHMNFASKHKHRFLLASFSVFILLPVLKQIQQSMGLPLLSFPFSVDKTYLASPFSSDFSSSAGQTVARVLPDTLILFNTENILFFVWLVGFTFLIIRLLVGFLRLQSIGRASDYDKNMLELCNSIKDEIKLRRQVKLYKNPIISSPVTYGILRPIILIPDDFINMPDECKRVALMHELLHIKRIDQFTGVLSQLILACYWFNPIMWVAVKQLRNQQEEACDECVLQMGVTPHDYAANMLEIVRKYRFN